MATEPPLGTRIKRARERKRWSQRQLADALQVNIKTIDNWENGRTSPRSSIGAIESVLGISLDDEPEPEPDIPPEVSDWIDRAIPLERQDALMTALRVALARYPRDEDEASGQSGHGRRAG